MSKQCVVSLATADIESRHIFRPWAFDEDSLAKLEYEWGFKYRTCNHDVATNRVYLTRELGHLFESGFWAFLPLEWDFFVDVLKISRASCSIPIETAYKGRKTFKYRFVPMPGILRSPIIRVEDSKPAHLQSHAFPFTSLPALELPILPHFAIIDLIHKFSKYKTLDIKPSAEYGPYLNVFYQDHSHSFCLYRLWITSRVPPEFLRMSDDDDADGEHIKPFKRQNACLSLQEDPATIWNDDRVGLRPLDSATNVSDNGEDESSDDEGDEDDGEDENEESRSLFDARLRRWIGGVGPSQAFEEPLEGAGCDHISAVPELISSDEDSVDSDSPSSIATVTSRLGP